MANFHVDVSAQERVKPEFLIFAGNISWAFHLDELARPEFRIPYEEIRAAAASATVIFTEKLADDR